MYIHCCTVLKSNLYELYKRGIYKHLTCTTKSQLWHEIIFLMYVCVYLYIYFTC